ncbi:MAG: apolipoprotein N-acyltransferase [Chitinivibrionales bacterium]|nr:apolipoprotein N-acyltransferase [Chitinivibrionales bacterium]
MMRNLFSAYICKISAWYTAKNRFWVPLLCGAMIGVCHSPFDRDFHWIFTLCPFLSFFVLIPFFAFSIQRAGRRWILDVYLFGISAALVQFYWLSNVMIKGLWPIIMVGLGALVLYLGLLYLLYGWLFRLVYRSFHSFFPVVFTSLWIISEYIQAIVPILFPWGFMGYSLITVLSVSQLVSITGVYGLSFLVVMSNCLFFAIVHQIREGGVSKKHLYQVYGMALVLICTTGWGLWRLQRHATFSQKLPVALIQSNIDQMNWNGQSSLDSAMAITESMIYEARAFQPRLVLIPESGVYCFLEYQKNERFRVMAWRDSIAAPMLLGTLHIEPENNSRYYRHRVYNSTFFLDSAAVNFAYYHKIKLLPFSEALPFEGVFPVLSRLNLGESDFSIGTEPVVFKGSSGLRYAPFLCSEIVYPNFVQARVALGCDIIIELTNNGWFGKSNAPYQHATIARSRAIENGLPLARCANSGISMVVDPLGRIVDKTAIYTRAVLTSQMPIASIPTVYRRFGDWIIGAATILCGLTLAISIFKKCIRSLKQKKSRSSCHGNF